MSEAHDRSEINALESALGKLSPSPAALDRDRLMFQAGRVAARRPWLWPAVAGAASLTAAALALVLVFRSAPVAIVEQRVVVIQQQTSPVGPAHSERRPETSEPVGEDEPPLPRAAYLRRLQEVLRWGVDTLPPSEPERTPSAPVLTPSAIRDNPDQPF